MGGGGGWGSTSGTILSYTSAIKQRYKGIPYSKTKSGDTKKTGKKSGVHSYTKIWFHNYIKKCKGISQIKYRGISKIPNTVTPNTVTPNRRFNFFGHIHKFKVRTLKEWLHHILLASKIYSKISIFITQYIGIFSSKHIIKYSSILKHL